MDRTIDYSIGLSFDDQGEIVFGSQVNADEVQDLAKQVFFLGVAITEKLETWKAAGEGGKLACIELCAMRRLLFFNEVPTKLQVMQLPQLLTLTKLLRASKKKESVDLTAEDISIILVALGQMVKPKPEKVPRCTSFQWSVKASTSCRKRIDLYLLRNHGNSL
jgi:hypothetical protein